MVTNWGKRLLPGLVLVLVLTAGSPSLQAFTYVSGKMPAVPESSVTQGQQEDLLIPDAGTASIGPTASVEVASAAAAKNTLPILAINDLSQLYGEAASRGAKSPLQLRTLAKGTGLYRHPTEAEAISLLKAASLVYQGLSSPSAMEEAAVAARSANYEIVRLTEGGRGEYLVLQPQGFSQGYFQGHAGFGIFIFNPQGNPQVVAEASHPIYDEGTVDMGLTSLKAIPAGVLLIAGADRRANHNGCIEQIAGASRNPGRIPEDFMGDPSDVNLEGNTRSMFYLWHSYLTQEISRQGGQPFVYQFHGFSHINKEKALESYDFVLSNGYAKQKVEPWQLVVIREELEKGGYSPLIYTRAQKIARPLAAAHNPQGRQTREMGGVFIHLETSDKLRKGGRSEAYSVEISRALARAQARLNGE